MKKTFLTIFGLLIAGSCIAGDYHQRTQSHPVVYIITDASGNPVTGQTPKLQVIRSQDGLVLDHNDNTFKSSGWTTRYATMTYNIPGEYYQRTVSIDSTTLISGDYVCVVSNDDAIYGDQQSEVVTFDTLNDLIKINR